ncbi:hypothetical protein CDAR_34581 [Caerostris darwini]|uniref:Uncharacterized protein n=1 Tax=Caerostris darwini TaxID=1538125 RepID=A0AAV4QDU5_9ARAC|nr:hypothetical protein CDAR_34581 [Caerostris darwini]
MPFIMSIYCYAELKKKSVAFSHVNTLSIASRIFTKTTQFFKVEDSILRSHLQIPILLFWFQILKHFFTFIENKEYVNALLSLM